jgi:hypothetical protein
MSDHIIIPLRPVNRINHYIRFLVSIKAIDIENIIIDNDYTKLKTAKGSVLFSNSKPNTFIVRLLVALS